MKDSVGLKSAVTLGERVTGSVRVGLRVTVKVPGGVVDGETVLLNEHVKVGELVRV